MSDKMDCFYAAKDIIMCNIQLQNDAIERLFKAKLELAIADNRKLPAVPNYKTVDLDDIFLLASKIEQFVDSPTEKTFLAE